MKSIKEYRANIQEFADRFGLTFEEKGECGFGRECVGLIVDENYVDYNPTTAKGSKYIDRFYDERFFDIQPPDAYHKYNCIAVLGRGKKAIRQLSEWVDRMNELGVVVEKYATGATGDQLVFSAKYQYATRIPKK